MTRWDGPPPQVVRVDLQTVELRGQLDDKITYDFWTFKGKVPGPSSACVSATRLMLLLDAALKHRPSRSTSSIRLRLQE